MGIKPDFRGGYFPPFIFELFKRIVSSFIDNFSSGWTKVYRELRFL